MPYIAINPKDLYTAIFILRNVRDIASQVKMGDDFTEDAPNWYLVDVGQLNTFDGISVEKALERLSEEYEYWKENNPLSPSFQGLYGDKSGISTGIQEAEYLSLHNLQEGEVCDACELIHLSEVLDDSSED